MGTMKMRAAIDDIAEVESVKVVTPLEAARKRGGVTVATANDDTDYMTSEINVIGRTADEAQTRWSAFLTAPFWPGCRGFASCMAPGWGCCGARCASFCGAIHMSLPLPSHRRTRAGRVLPRLNCGSEGPLPPLEMCQSPHSRYLRSGLAKRSRT